MNKIRQYFLGDILAKTDDVFEQARAIMLLRMAIMFGAIFLLPLIFDILLHYYKALVIHGFAFIIILSFPFILKHQKNIDKSINFFFVVSFFISISAFMCLNPDRIDKIGVCWTVFFLVVSAILQKGKARILFCCFINWIPLLYVVVNTNYGGILTVDAIVQEGAEDPPIFLMFIPIIMTIYAVWTNSKTSEVAKLKMVEQKKMIDEKNKDLTDSIQYAKRLQEALLPPVKLINENLTENFIYYLPKDIVAGDFYWFEKQNNLIFIAAADCTGHGVPGAMVSVVCSGALTRTIKEFNIIQPDLILNKTRQLVLEAFEKSSVEVQDGMDISLVCIDTENKKISWAGANNSLWYINPNDRTRMEEIKPDKQPIGKTDVYKSFTLHSFNYDTGTLVYLFTDGFADQFGGPKGKKFKYKQLSNLLLLNCNLKLEKQKEKLNDKLIEWKGNLSQVDDICLIGIKL